MVKKFCIKTCKSESYSGCGVSFYCFPSKEEMKQKWLDVIPEPISVTENSVVCSLNFNPADFLMAKSRRVLNYNTVPSIFAPPINKQVVVLSDIVLPLLYDVEPIPSTSQAGLSDSI